MTKNLVFSALIALAVSFVVAISTGDSESNVVVNDGVVVGSLSGRDIKGISLDIVGPTLVNTFTEGGGVRATSTSGSAVPLVATDFDTENLIDVTLNIVDATLSFPATSTLKSFLPNAGDSRTLYIRNASTTAAMDLTITGGTGVLLKNASSTAVIVGDTDGANFAIIRLIRKANTDIEALMIPYRD